MLHCGTSAPSLGGWGGWAVMVSMWVWGVEGEAGQNLQRQYERWQPRARYRQSLDPTVEEVRRLATGLRRSAR